MTKEEMLAALKEAAVLNVKKAEDTVDNIDAKEVKTPVEKADGVKGLDSELPTQKEVEKVVNADEGPMVAVDKDGVSKNGGESDLMEPGKVEAERKKEDNGMKDVINVSDRKIEENAEVSNELLAQLKEASDREAGYKAKIAEITALCEKALKVQQEELTKEHANEMRRVFEAVIAEGEKLEGSLIADAAKNEKMYKTAQRMYEGSSKLNKILLEAVKRAQPKREMTRYMTAGKRALASLG